MSKDISLLILSGIICYSIGLFSALGTVLNVSEWKKRYVAYSLIRVRPWLFVLLWLLIYTCMSISFYFVWQASTEELTLAMVVFVVQLFLNASWAFLFLTQSTMLLSITENTSLVMSVLLVLLLFVQIGPQAGFFLIPYLMWICYVSGFNFSIAEGR